MTVEKEVTLWSSPDCGECDRIFKWYLNLGYAINKKDVDKLMSGEEPDLDAMTALAYQNNALPIIREFGSVFVKPGDVK